MRAGAAFVRSFWYTAPAGAALGGSGRPRPLPTFSHVFLGICASEFPGARSRPEPAPALALAHLAVPRRVPDGPGAAGADARAEPRRLERDGRVRRSPAA